MSQLTAHTVLPLFSALSLEEQQAFLQEAGKLVSLKAPKPKSKTKKNVYDKLNPLCRPENREQLVSAIMHNVEFQV